MPFQGEEGRADCVEGRRMGIAFFFIFKVICLLLACPCGVFDLGLAFKSI